jgi:UDP-3-O-[3-hydroxymyristoyl] glucosamine N-acyltransferase
MSTTAREIANFLLHEGEFEDFAIITASSLRNIKNYSLVFVNDTTQIPTFESDVEFILFLAKNLFSAPKNSIVLQVDNPRLRFAQVVKEFFVSARIHGVSITSRCSSESVISESATVGEFSVIEDGVVIGDEVVIGHHTVICSGVVIGNRSQIGSNSVIGTSGLGFEKDHNGIPVRIPHIGGVVIGNDVEIGSCVVIARGTIDDTIIEDFTKIDDHVFIAHNVRIGSKSILVAGSEVSGSVQVGEECWIGPLSTIRDGLIIGKKSVVGMGAVVTKDVPENVTVAGNPARIFK